jgi:hypothetical protein
VSSLIPTDRAAWQASWRRWWSPTWHRDRSGPDWLQWLWTFAFNLTIATGLTLLAWGFSKRIDLATAFWWNFVIAQSIGFTIHILFRIGLRLLGADRLDRFTFFQRALFYAGIPIVSVFIGYGIGLTLLGVDVVEIVVTRPQLLFTIIAMSLLMSAFWYRYMANRARLAEAEAEREREKARSAQIERSAADAQLRALQAQIEPHFLFNTLANVVSLIESQPAQARQMVNRLIDLLRGSLDASRTTDGTLAQEVALVRAYLDILAVRMGARLAYTIDVPEALSALAFPPLTLQPLVENAIKHGLEPKLSGGHIVIRARADRSGLAVEVQDDGLGFRPTAASGLGLSNLRERLVSRFGAAARVVIEERSPGTVVRLLVPSTDPSRAVASENRAVASVRAVSDPCIPRPREPNRS